MLPPNEATLLIGRYNGSSIVVVKLLGKASGAMNQLSTASRMMSHIITSSSCDSTEKISSLV